jgi:prepilin-type processing-associated H-X9-DG protein
MSSPPQLLEEERRGRPLFSLLGVAVFVVIALGAVLWPAVQGAREAARRASCIGQNKFFGGDMYTYHDRNGRFPPAYIADEQGQPAHSWRVLVLQTDMRTLYDRYHFDEAWNSPHNRDLAGGLPIGMSGVCPWYHCATDVGSDRLDTSYVMAVGPETISPGPTSRSMKEITDGTAHTVVVAEMSESGIHWMEPRDLDFEKMSFKINDKEGEGVRSRHPGVAVVAFADGSVQAIREDVDPEVVKALFTINGGESGVRQVYER